MTFHKIFNEENRFQLYVNFQNKNCIVIDNAPLFTNKFDMSNPSDIGYLVNLLNELWEENKKYRDEDHKENKVKETTLEREKLRILCEKINNKMHEVYIKTPETCYMDYRNQLYRLLEKMDTSIESFNKYNFK